MEDAARKGARKKGAYNIVLAAASTDLRDGEGLRKPVAAIRGPEARAPDQVRRNMGRRYQ